MKERTCVWCGSLLPSSKRSDAKYCNRQCKGAAGSARRRRQRPKKMRAYWRAYSRKKRADPDSAYAAKHDISYRNEIRTCLVCDKPFQPNTARHVNCTRACTKARAAAKYEPKRASAKRTSERERYQIETYGRVLPPEEMSKDKYRHARKKGFRSGLEVRIARQLEGIGQGFDYEPFKVPYVQPAKDRRFTPDFVLPNGIIIEAKGRWTTQDRRKFLMIEDCWPDLDIRFVFSRSATTISKRSKTTYADYCRTNGWQYADKEIPLSWIRAPKNTDSISAIREILKDRINQK